MKIKRERTFPADFAGKILNPELGIECRYSEEKLTAKMYAGKSNRPYFFLRFKTVQRMYEYILTQVEEIEKQAARKNERQQTRKANNANLNISDHYKVGDIIVDTWGWEQTNVYYYEVVDVLNKKIRVRAICKNYKETGFMSGNSVPFPGVFKKDEEPFLLTIKADHKNNVVISSPDYHYYHKWDGKEQYESHYA